MRVVKGRVVGQTVVLEEPLPEGTEVAVIASAAPQRWNLSEVEWADLHSAREAIERGEFVTDETLQAELDAIDRE